MTDDPGTYPHPDQERLVDLARLLGARSPDIIEHVAGCDDCRNVLRVAGATREALSPASDPVGSNPDDAVVQVLRSEGAFSTAASGLVASHRQSWRLGLVSASSLCAAVIGFMVALTGVGAAGGDGRPFVQTVLIAGFAAALPVIHHFYGASALPRRSRGRSAA